VPEHGPSEISDRSFTSLWYTLSGSAVVLQNPSHHFSKPPQLAFFFPAPLPFWSIRGQLIADTPGPDEMAHPLWREASALPAVSPQDRSRQQILRPPGDNVAARQPYPAHSPRRISRRAQCIFKFTGFDHLSRQDEGVMEKGWSGPSRRFCRLESDFPHA